MKYSPHVNMPGSNISIYLPILLLFVLVKIIWEGYSFVKYTWKDLPAKYCLYNEKFSQFVRLSCISFVLNPPNINFNPPISAADGTDDFWKVRVR